jgi:cystathionine beta-lyase/cystathionine gamma-synthase
MPVSPSDFTLAVHPGTSPEPLTGAIMTPIFQTSTFVQESPGVHKGYDYSRADNPTREKLERAYALLEKARYGLAFSSGLAAEQAIMQILEPGTTVLVCEDVYGGTGRLFRRLFAKYGFDFRFIDMRNLEEIKKNIKENNTSMIWAETPTNPTLRIVDLKRVAQIAKENNALFVVDNTFSSPLFQSPLELGADIVVHSTTKYIGGHSDIIGGSLMLNNSDLYEKLKFVQFAAGAVPAPFECFLLLRSILTLGVRMEQHEKNAIQVAQFLEQHKSISKVYFPGLKSHPQYDLAKSQMSGFSGMVSFDLKGDYQSVLDFLKKLKVFALAESLGGVESLINHPEKMTHASVPPDLRKKLGINSNLLRLSVGIESASDLVKDLEQALS